jgi:CsoR family transcriptional regulator, copper-sensing transcriptional repressor
MAGYIDGKDALLNRLRRIEGQVRGLERMVESQAYCIDILTQVTAATRGLQVVALELLDDHLAHYLHGEKPSRVTARSDRELSDDAVRAAVDEAGYQVVEIEK